MFNELLNVMETNPDLFLSTMLVACLFVLFFELFIEIGLRLMNSKDDRYIFILITESGFIIYATFYNWKMLSYMKGLDEDIKCLCIMYDMKVQTTSGYYETYEELEETLLRNKIKRILKKLFRK